jgi:regulation of enolase protein 1 (concanavalin A-like superfamily)
MGMEWLNEPAAWSAAGEHISVTAGPKTDFWRKTHYGFINDSGHIYGRKVTGDFDATVKVIGAYTTLYDQAGLMVRQDETTWIKTGIEFVDGVQYMSAVFTRDYSDWSVDALADSPPAIWLQVKRRGTAIEVHFSRDGATYTMHRMGYLPAEGPALVGVMCASPQGEGFTVEFDGLTIWEVNA